MKGPVKPYLLYGLAVDSTLPLPCPRVPVSRCPDVRLRPACAARFQRACRLSGLSSTPGGWFECQFLPTGATYLRWARLFEFLISSNARTIEYRALEDATDESLVTYLVGQVLSFSLLSLGYEPLHATAVVVNGEAIAFLGDCGYGKSTLGAAFLALGFPILTDDVLALEFLGGGWIAHAGPRRLKLFPSVAQRVLSRGNGARLNADTSKAVLPLTDTESSCHPVPMRALYVLAGPAQRTDRRPAGVNITPLEGQEAVVEVIRSAFNLIQVDRARLRNQFTIATRLVRDVPMRRLAYPRRLSCLNTICEALITDIAL